MKIRNTVKITLIIAGIWLLVIQFGFYFILKNQSEQVSKSIASSFRSEALYSNFSFVARQISDFEHLNLISCARLTMKYPANRSILDSSINGGCGSNFIIFTGRVDEIELKTINGDLYSLNYFFPSGLLFQISLWVLRLIGLVLIISIQFYNYKIRQRDLLIFNLEKATTQKLIHQASQISHDIRSPLAALNMIINGIEQIPEAKKMIIKNSVNRINDIANNLLKGQKTNSSGEHFNSKETYIEILLNNIVSEKRALFIQNQKVSIQLQINTNDIVISKIDPSEFQRILSNLINNSVEASDPHKQNNILITLSSNASNCEILINDTGKGIPQHILEKLGQRGLTHGKENSESGSGLGVYHAIETIKKMGGEIHFESEIGKGTQIQITFPMVEDKSQVKKTIEISSQNNIVFLDDDSSLHQVFDLKLKDIRQNNDVKVYHLNTATEFVNFIKANPDIYMSDQSWFLLDLDLGISQPNTLEILQQQTTIPKNIIFITSNFENPELTHFIGKHNLNIFPKQLYHHLNFASNEKCYYDWVLIDDDELVHMVWNSSSVNLNKSLVSFYSVSEFLNAEKNIDRRSNIFLDVSFTNGENGIDLSHQIHNLGFKQISLVTGYDAESLTVPQFIHSILGKEPPGFNSHN